MIRSYPKRGEKWTWMFITMAAVAAVAALLFYASVASAATVTWTLTGVTFSDGGTATGTFDFDANTQATSNVNISVSGGNTTFFPLTTYDQLQGLFNLENPQKTYIFQETISPDPGNVNRRALRLTPVAALTNAGGTVALNLATAGGGSGGVECFNCAPFRLINAGSLVAAIATIAVDIDIKPGSDPNCFNNDGNGVIPVAILGSAAFDVTQVDDSTVVLEGLAIKAVGKKGKLLSHIEDVNNDTFDDLVVQIQDSDGIFSVGDATATLMGNLKLAFGSTPIQGSDSICITQ